MRVCPLCETPKPLTPEYWYRERVGSDTLRNPCKDCMNSRRRAWFKANPDRRNAKAREDRRRRREWLDSLKADKPCLDCGGEFPPYVMDFDHRDPATKLHNVARMLDRNRPETEILAEIAKCDLVCANCHRIRTHGPQECRVLSAAS